MPPEGVFVGAATLDLHYLVDRFPEQGTKGPAAAFGMYAGGPAANAAVTFAYLGGEAKLVTEIGSHPAGSLIAADLADHGVRVVDLIDGTDAEPMVSAVVTTAGTGERTVIASHYPDTGISGKAEPLPSEADVLLLDGFLTHTALAAATEAGQRGVRVVLDAGSWKEGTTALLPFVTVAACSADFHPPGTASPVDVAAVLGDFGVESVVVTAGADPIHYWHQGSHATVPVQPVVAVDTLGAGDVFHGALCHHLAAGEPLPTAVAAAARVATFSVRSFGTRAWMEGHPPE